MNPSPVRRSVRAILVLSLASCGRRGSGDGSRVDTTIVSTPLPAPAASAPILRISITRDAKVYADGRAVTLPGLDSLFAALKAIKGVVWYYQEASARGPAAKQASVITSVLDAVIRHQLPVRLSSKPDFSDAALERGQARPVHP